MEDVGFNCVFCECGGGAVLLEVDAICAGKEIPLPQHQQHPFCADPIVLFLLRVCVAFPFRWDSFRLYTT